MYMYIHILGSDAVAYGEHINFDTNTLLIQDRYTM